jgi:hypothetical protein
METGSYVINSNINIILSECFIRNIWFETGSHPIGGVSRRATVSEVRYGNARPEQMSEMWSPLRNGETAKGGRMVW